MKYGRTDPRTERKIMAGFFVAVAILISMLFLKNSGVHVTSVKRTIEKDKTTEFAIEVANPHDYGVVATICLSTGTAASDAGLPYGALTKQLSVEIPAETSKVSKIVFDPIVGMKLGPMYSATLVNEVRSGPAFKEGG